MIPRRDFLGTVAGAAAALSVSPALAATPSVPGGSAFVETVADFDVAGFTKLATMPKPNKVVWDLTKIGKALGNVKNSLNGYHFGFGYGPGQAHAIMALHGAANTANFSDEMWAKYRLGEWLKIDDPKTDKPATRNIWLHSTSDASTDPQNPKSIYQDTSIEGLQRRGVSFFT